MTTETTEAPKQTLSKDAEILGLTFEQFKTLGVADPSALKYKDKIPGLELTWEIMAALDMDLFEGSKILQNIKKHPDFASSKIVIVPAGEHKLIFRCPDNTEWLMFNRGLKSAMKLRDEMSAKGEDANDIEREVRNHVYEVTLQRFCVYPKLNAEHIRSFLPGDMATAHEAFTQAMGFGQTPTFFKV